MKSFFDFFGKFFEILKNRKKLDFNWKCFCPFPLTMPTQIREPGHRAEPLGAIGRQITIVIRMRSFIFPTHGTGVQRWILDGRGFIILVKSAKLFFSRQHQA